MPPRVQFDGPLQNHLKAWRKHRGMTLEQLGAAIGTGKPHLSQVERGIVGMTEKLAEAAAKALGIDSETLRRRAPGEAMDAEGELLALFRNGDGVQRRLILEMARTIRAVSRREAMAEGAEAGLSDDIG